MKQPFITRNGVTVSAFEIEAILNEVPGVEVGLAIGFANAHCGEEIGAYIVVETGMHLSDETVLAYCRKKLGFERSPKVVVFGKDAPTNADGTYKRAPLKRLFAAWRETRFRDGVKR